MSASRCANYILEDDRAGEVPAPGPPASRHPLLDHPLAPELMEHIVQWIRQESLGVDAAGEFAQVYETASKMVRGG